MSSPKKFAVFAGVLLVVFAKPLLLWASFCLHSDLYSHCVLVPFISAYLVWVRLKSTQGVPFSFDRALGVGSGLLGLLTAACAWAFFRNGVPDDFLAVTVCSFLLLLAGGAFLFLGAPFMWHIAFPAFFLVFMAPFPTLLRDGIAAFLQHGSSDTSELLLSLAGMPLIRSGTFFQLPAFQMEVAPECSGIHSTVALFVSSLVAGYLLLPGWKSRTLLSAAVMPLALMRNGFRIFTISQLCVQIDPEYIHSIIHRRGGPIFFAFSLISLFLLLLFLRNREERVQTGLATGITNRETIP